jgi:Mg2+/Co2+ transporter CorB
MTTTSWTDPTTIPATTGVVTVVLLVMLAGVEELTKESIATAKGKRCVHAVMSVCACVLALTNCVVAVLATLTGDPLHAVQASCNTLLCGFVTAWYGLRAVTASADDW